MSLVWGENGRGEEMRLIDADELKIPGEELIAKMAIALAPTIDATTIDAVEVVRCRDCKWYKTMYCKMDRWTDLVTVYVAKEDDYCSYGEKWKGAKMYERWKDE